MLKFSPSRRSARASRKALRGILLRTATATIAASVFSSSTHADSISWDNDSNDFLWATPSNWSTNALPSSSDTAFFNDVPANAVGTVNLGGSTQSVDGVNFANTSLTSFVLSNGTLSLNRLDQSASDGANNQITANISAAGSTLTASILHGLLDVPGQVAANSLVITPTTSGDGALALHNISNSFSGITISAGGILQSYEPNSLGTPHAINTPIALSSGGTIQLYTNTLNANYTKNDVVVTGSTNGLSADGYSPSPLQYNTLNLWRLTMNANASLSFSARSGDQIKFSGGTSINSAANFAGFVDFVTQTPGKLALGSISELSANSSIHMSGIGELVLSSTSTYTGGTFITGGMVTASVNGSLGTGEVDVSTDGAINLASAQSPVPTLFAGKNNEPYSAVVGNLTGAIYSGASQNVHLANNSILGISTGPEPVRGTDVSGANYYKAITSNNQTLTVGDDNSTSIYKGAAFGPYTPNGATPTAFTGSIAEDPIAIANNQELPIYLSASGKSFSNPTFNTTTSVHFFGPGGVTFANAPLGTATTFSHTGNGSSTQSTFLTTLNNHHILTAGKTFSVNDGIFYPAFPDAVDAGAIVNINSGATLYTDTATGPTAGTYNIASGGAYYLASSTATPNAGAAVNFAPGSLLIIDDIGTVDSGSPSTWISPNSDIVIDAASPLSVTGSGLVLGNNKRLTTGPNRTVTVAPGAGIHAAAGATNVILSGSGANSVLDIKDNLSLPNTALQVGDASNFTTVDFTTRSSQSQNGIVKLEGNVNTIGGLSIQAGQLDITDKALVVNYAAGDTTHATRDAIRNLLKIGRNGGPGQPGNWNGNGGITSSFAHTNGNGFNLAIGYADNTDLASVRAGGSYTSFGGQTVASNTILIQLTRGADATLDGLVDSQDVTILGSHFNKPGSGQWVFGDFDYSGTCDATDVTTLGSTFGKTTPTMSPAQLTAEFGAAFTSAFEGGQAAAIPEPGSLSLLGLGGLTLMAWRRRKRRRNAVN